MYILENSYIALVISQTVVLMNFFTNVWSCDCCRDKWNHNHVEAVVSLSTVISVGCSAWNEESNIFWVNVDSIPLEMMEITGDHYDWIKISEPPLLRCKSIQYNWLPFWYYLAFCFVKRAVFSVQMKTCKTSINERQMEWMNFVLAQMECGKFVKAYSRWQMQKRRKGPQRMYAAAWVFSAMSISHGWDVG